MHKKLIYVATNNEHKISEFQAILPSNVDVKPYAALGLLVEWVENGNTFLANSFIKSRAIAQKTSHPVLADDSGLCVYNLDLKPGVHSARYAQETGNDRAAIDRANRSLLLKEMDHLKNPENRKAYFTTVITYVDAEKNEYSFEGRCDGTIATKESGANGFGYDSIFIGNGMTRSFAELTAQEKNSLSHRGAALEKFAAFLKTQI